MTINSVFTSIPLTISMYNDELECFRRVSNSISQLFNYLEKQGVARIVCTDTAELIEVDELRRVHGILDGLVRRNNWEGRAE